MYNQKQFIQDKKKVLSVYPNFSDEEIKTFLFEREKLLNQEPKILKLTEKIKAELRNYVEESTIKQYEKLIGVRDAFN